MSDPVPLPAPGEDPARAGKVVTIARGDCLVNIGAAEGFFWKTIWEHPENRELRQKRKAYNIPKEGDRLYIPDVGAERAGRATRAPIRSSALFGDRPPEDHAA
jgi:hypothetical protein